MIYFLRRADGAIKIGTTTQYHMRLSQLITQYGDFELLGLMEGGREVEHELHQRFASFRISRTEFFTDHNDIREFISQSAKLQIPDRRLEPKGIRIAASTLTRLEFLADILDTTISSVIDHALETSYPNVDAMVEELQAKKRALRKTLETRADP